MDDSVKNVRKKPLKTCAYCEIEHYGKQVKNDQLEDYVCLKCDRELKWTKK